MWDMLAYAARYGKQPLDVLFSLSSSDIERFNSSVSEIVGQENTPKRGT